MNISLKSVIYLALSFSASGQLIPNGTPLPKTPKPPIVFVNGYTYACGTAASFADTFGKFDQFLQTSNRVVVFFDNCNFTPKPAIEELGNQFSLFLGRLKYTDGTLVPQVDVVMHSMGGLIVRSYLAGMQTSGVFSPPADPKIRKMVFLSTPHFGTDLAAVYGSDIQTSELNTGSTFVFNLATWNQGADDLRGIDALSVTGNNGVGSVGGNPDTDGVSSLNSSSIGFAVANRTRILPYCHISYTDLVDLAGVLAGFVCKPASAGIAKAVLSTDSNVQIVQSFLNDTIDWQNIGQAAEQNPVLMTQAGVVLRTKSPGDQFLIMQDAAIGTTALAVPATAASANTVGYKEFVTPGLFTAKATTTAGVQQQPVTLNAGYTNTVTLKGGPFISRVLPAASVVSPLNLAPGTFAAIYGSGFSTSAITAPATPFPTTLGGVQVLANGNAIPLYFVGPSQIDAVFPLALTGLVTVTVTSAGGQSAVRVLMAPAVPAIFTQDGSGAGSASALNAVTGALVGPSSPLRGGDYVSFYLTGLGAKTASNGLQVANIQPTVTIGGKPCIVQYAGATPVYAGLDQINCQVPTGLASNPATPVTVLSGARAANNVTVAIQ